MKKSTYPNALRSYLFKVSLVNKDENPIDNQELTTNTTEIILNSDKSFVWKFLLNKHITDIISTSPKHIVVQFLNPDETTHLKIKLTNTQFDDINLTESSLNIAKTDTCVGKVLVKYDSKIIQ